MGKISFLPGVPFQGFALDNKNPGGIRNSTGSNTHVPPKAPTVCTKVFADGREDTWLEFVPDDFDPASNPPLFISCHGGGVNGPVQFDETSWIYVAQVAGGVAVFPSAGIHRAWLSSLEDEKVKNFVTDLDPDGPGTVDPDAHDFKFILGLIDEMHKKYNIDLGRVYMQGMSMGDLMTFQFARVYGDRLAGINSTAGPTPREHLFDKDGNPKGFKCPVPAMQTRGELDWSVISKREPETVTRQDINAANRRFWQIVNGCDELPRLMIKGDNNLAFFTGKEAPVVFRDVKHRNHGQTLDDAMWAWFTLFSRTRRMEDGSIRYYTAPDAAVGDKNAAALAEGCPWAYVNNQKVRLEAAPIYVGLRDFDMVNRTPRDEVRMLSVPVSFLAQYFGAKVSLRENSRVADITVPDGRVLTVGQESVVCLENGERIYAMTVEAKLQDGVLFVPVKWFAENVFGMHVTECLTSLYISDHHGEMTKDMAFLIHEILA